MEPKLKSSKTGFGLSISKKEKDLLLLLSAVIVFWLFYRYIMPLQNAEHKRLQGDKEFKLGEKARIQELLATEKIIDRELDSVKDEYRRAVQKYYYGVDQPELIHMLNVIIDSSKLGVPGINFEKPKDADLAEADAKLTKVAIAYKGSFIDLENILSMFRHSPKRLLIDQLSFNRKDKDTLDGQMSLKAIGYMGIEEEREGYFYNNGYTAQGRDNPFKAYKGYVETAEGTKGGDNDERRTILADMESDAIYFMTADTGVTGNVERIKGGKFGNTVVRAEYFISTGYQPERAYVVLDDQDITIKYPPQSAGVWAFSYGYSPVTLGMRYKTPEGEKIDIELSKGVNWIGWKYISAAPPQDVKLYPLKLDRLYAELAPGKDDYGVILFDRIEASYAKSKEEAAAVQSYEFYVVQPGDTLMSISNKFYGTRSLYTRVMKDNSLTSANVLKAGQVLVIRK